MKKETFVGIIGAIQAQRNREVVFSEAIKDAYVGAGEEPDFRESESYLPPTSVLTDAILESLAPEFVSANQTQENALDVINYYMYELSMMNYQFIEPPINQPVYDASQPDAGTGLNVVPAYITHQNGTKLLMDTPEHLYDTLVYCMETPAQSNQEPTTPVDPQTELRSSLAATEKSLCTLNSEEETIWNIIKPIIEDKLDVKDIQLDNRMVDLEGDSLDCVETAIAIETACGITFTDDEWDDINRDMPFHQLVKLIHEKRK